MIDTLASALAAANTAFDFLKRSVTAHDQAKIETATADLVDKLRAVNESALNTTQEALKLAQDMRAMDQKLAALERENQEMKARAERRSQYTLVDIGGGALAYRYNAVEGSTDASHYLCQPCMSKGQEIALQPHGRHGNYKCPACDTTYITDGGGARQGFAIR